MKHTRLQRALKIQKNIICDFWILFSLSPRTIMLCCLFCYAVLCCLFVLQLLLVKSTNNEQSRSTSQSSWNLKTHTKRTSRRRRDFLSPFLLSSLLGRCWRCLWVPLCCCLSSLDEEKEDDLPLLCVSLVDSPIVNMASNDDGKSWVRRGEKSSNL